MIEPSVPDPVPVVVSPGTPLPAPARVAVRSLSLGLGLWGLLARQRAGAYCHRAYFSARRGVPHPTERALVARATEIRIPWESPARAPYPVSGTLCARWWGDETRPAVLLAHGWGQRGTQLGRSYVEPLLGAGFRVVTVDMPGHGDSVGDQSDLLSFAAALRQTADAVGPVTAVIGHSLGVAATAMAIAEGMACQKIVGIGAAVWLETFPERFSRTLRLSSSVRDELYRRLHATFAADEWRAWSLDQVAPRMTVPALFVHDRDDAETSFTGSVAAARRWPGARLMLTQGHGHNRVMAVPAVVSAVMSFLAGS